VVTGSAVPGEHQDMPGEVVATADGKPVWMTASEGAVRHDVCWVSRPWIKSGECVFEHLNPGRFLNLLPVLEWLRWVSDYREWQQPSLRACFMFDDPNLHSPRYGFLDFEHLAAEGRRRRYHTAFATVPLDGYYVSKKAARLLRDNSQTLSLLLHGNNHTHRELACDQPPARQLALMRQAVFRACRLEEKAGATVARVMAPPHGLCSAGMMAAMAEAGLEAVCVSHGSVWTANPGAAWTISLGALPAMVVAGLPIIPRFGLTKSENNILLAAYLNQPIIPVGHHWDLADGTDVLSSAARLINGLGNVAWSDLTAIARNNYRFRLRSQVMQVQTWSRTTTLTVPEGVSELELEAPWLDSERECIECRHSGSVGPKPSAAAQSDLPFQVIPGSSAELAVRRSSRNGDQPYALARTPLGTVARKVLAEARDRAMPYLPRRWVKR
jgi:hypothetical protein